MARPKNIERQRGRVMDKAPSFKMYPEELQDFKLALSFMNHIAAQELRKFALKYTRKALKEMRNK